MIWYFAPNYFPSNKELVGMPPKFDRNTIENLLWRKKLSVFKLLSDFKSTNN